MMRKAAGVGLIGLGLFAVVLAILLPTVVVDRSKKTPLDLDITQVSSGTAKLLDTTTNQVKDVKLRATRVVKTDSHASDANNTTVFETLCTVIVEGNTPNCVRSSDPRLLSVTTDRVTADRRSAESVHVAKWNENINGKPARHVGLTYKWPIDATKKTYQFFMPDLAKAFPAVYAGTERVAGLKVYKYVCKSGVQPYKVQDIFDGTYDDTTTVWVEPLTGAIIYGVEHQVQKLAGGQVALDATLKFDKKAVDDQAKYSQDKIDQLKQAQLWGPLALAIIAVASFVGAFFLLRRRTSGGNDTEGLHSDGAPTPDDDPNQAEPPVWAGSSSS
jgi:hypothetical protein